MPQRDLADSPAVLGRIVAADMWTPIWEEVVNRTFTSWTLDRLSALSRMASPPDALYNQQQLQALLGALVQEQRAPMIGLVAKGAGLASEELGTKTASVTKQFYEPDPADEELIAPYRADVETHLQQIASLQTQAFAEVIDRAFAASLDVYDQGTGLGETVAGLAKRIEKQLLLEVEGGRADQASQVARRAKMIARTESLWSANEGAARQYQAAGVVQLEWFATEDDVVCQYCVQFDGQIVGVGVPFAEAGDPVSGAAGGSYTPKLNVRHPPLHPHCRCVVLPVTELTDPAESRQRGDQLREDFKKRVDSGEWEADKKRRADKLRRDRGLEEEGLTDRKADPKRKKRPKVPDQFAPRETTADRVTTQAAMAGAGVNDFALDRLISDVRNLDNGLTRDNTNKFLETASLEEMKEVRKYTRGAGPYHDYLLRGKLRPNLTEEKIQKRIKTLDSALEKAPKMEQNTRVFRSEKSWPGIEALWEHARQGKGATFTRAGYLSTSINRREIDRAVFGGKNPDTFTMEVLIPKGKRGLYVEPFSLYQGQAEVLLPRNAVYKVKKVDTINGRRHLLVEVVEQPTSGPDFEFKTFLGGVAMLKQERAKRERFVGQGDEELLRINLEGKVSDKVQDLLKKREKKLQAVRNGS